MRIIKKGYGLRKSWSKCQYEERRNIQIQVCVFVCRYIYSIYKMENSLHVSRNMLFNISLCTEMLYNISCSIRFEPLVSKTTWPCSNQT